MSERSKAVIARLRAHAGFDSSEPIDGSIAAITSPAIELHRQSVIDGSEDVLDALEDLNVLLNGSTPSESVSQSDAIPRAIIASVFEIVRMLREAGCVQEADLIHMAWGYVLDGDIDSLREELGHR